MNNKNIQGYNSVLKTFMEGLKWIYTFLLQGTVQPLVIEGSDGNISLKFEVVP